MAAEKISWFETVAEAIQFITARGLAKNEVVLVKGSRSLQMERIVEIMETQL